MRRRMTGSFLNCRCFREKYKLIKLNTSSLSGPLIVLCILPCSIITYMLIDCRTELQYVSTRKNSERSKMIILHIFFVLLGDYLTNSGFEIKFSIISIVFTRYALFKCPTTVFSNFYARYLEKIL